MRKIMGVMCVSLCFMCAIDSTQTSVYGQVNPLEKAKQKKHREFTVLSREVENHERQVVAAVREASAAKNRIQKTIDNKKQMEGKIKELHMRDRALVMTYKSAKDKKIRVKASVISAKRSRDSFEKKSRTQVNISPTVRAAEEKRRQKALQIAQTNLSKNDQQIELSQRDTKKLQSDIKEAEDVYKNKVLVSVKQAKKDYRKKLRKVKSLKSKLRKAHRKMTAVEDELLKMGDEWNRLYQNEQVPIHRSPERVKQREEIHKRIKSCLKLKVK